MAYQLLPIIKKIVANINDRPCDNKEPSIPLLPGLSANFNLLFHYRNN